jgi:formate hydrogenlyase subunit 3/multisubunit Na+/H+ antiporter MnhD subunit
MTKIQLIPFLPIFSIFLAFLLNFSSKYTNISLWLANKISLISAILFLVCCFGLTNQSIAFYSLSIKDGLGFAWVLDKDNLLFLLLIGWLWLSLELYTKSYFQKSGDIKINQFRILLLSIVAVLTFLVLAKNLLSALLCYQLLVLILSFTSLQFATKINQKSAKNFILFLSSSLVLLPLAVVFTFKIFGNLDFVEGGMVAINKINLWQYSILFCCYFASLALIAFVPVYLLFSNLYHFSPPLIITILLGSALSALILLFKIIFYIFGHQLFINFSKIIDYHYLITIILTLNLFICGLLAIFSKNLKQILIFLFFNQMIFLVIEFFNFGLNAKQMQISIIAFALSQLAIFLVIGNINLYLKVSSEKALNGIFYKLKITILMLILILFSIIGLVPGIGMLEKYWLIKSIIAEKSWINAIILLINFLLLFLCMIKISYPMIEIFGKSYKQKNYDISKTIAKEIDSNLGLVLPIFLTLLLIVIMFFAR